MSKITHAITLQDIFNAAWDHFIVNNSPPCVVWNEFEFACKYKTNGNMCAVGLVLPDIIAYIADRRNSTFSEIVNENEELFDLKSFHILLSIDDVQRCLHDQLINRKTGEWLFNASTRRIAYINFANQHYLSIPST